MTKLAHVYNMSNSTDPPYPQLLPSHPRNRAVRWTEIGDYAEHGSPSEERRFDIFVRTRRGPDGDF